MSISVYVLCKVQIGKIRQVVDALRELEAATSITVVTGEFDIIVRFDLPNLEILYDLTIQKLGKIDGIREMTTAVVEKEL